jgi:hypothetical protein
MSQLNNSFRPAAQQQTLEERDKNRCGPEFFNYFRKRAEKFLDSPVCRGRFGDACTFEEFLNI